MPIGELYGGTENWPSPFGGMGLLKTENEQIKDEKDKNMCKLLGMKVYDKGIYVKEVPKTEVTNYRIEKENLLHK